MGIYISDAKPKQRQAIDEVQYFLIRGDGCLRQFSHSGENDIALPEIAQGEFAVPPVLEQPAERPIAGPPTIDPDGRVY